MVDMTHFDTGAQSVLAYATVHGLLVGWDLRAPKVAWQLKNDSKLGSFFQLMKLSFISPVILMAFEFTPGNRETNY